MKVRYIRGKAGVSKSNIMFATHFPMRGGKFPSDHPCAANPEPSTFGTPEPTDDPLGRFRADGYPDASCFPEGDGLCFKEDPAVSDEKVRADIVRCFGFEVVDQPARLNPAAAWPFPAGVKQEPKS